MGGHIDYENQYTLAQQRAIAIVPAVTSLLSILGSLAIIRIILNDRGRKLRKVKHRLILSMSVLDVICSFWFGSWALPVPRGQRGVWGAAGNDATCAAQGFFIQWQIAVPMYNAALSIYYYLVVVKKKKDDEIARRFEPAMHLLSNAYPFATGIAALWVDGGLYSFDSIGCWIAPHPRGCKHADGVACARGEWAYLFQWLFAGVEEAGAAIVIAFCMFFVYREVRSAEMTMKTRYSFQRGSVSDSASLAAASRSTLHQALAYVAIVVATRFWSFVVVMVDEFGGANRFAIVMLQQFWFPLQGFWNAVVYVHPYYKNVRRAAPGASRWRCAREAVLRAPTEEDLEGGGAHGRRRRGSAATLATRRMTPPAAPRASSSSSSRNHSGSAASLRAAVRRLSLSLRGDRGPGSTTATSDASAPAAARSVGGVPRSAASSEACEAMGEGSRGERRKSKRVSFQDNVDASIQRKDGNEFEETRNEADDSDGDEESGGISSIGSADDEDEESAGRLSAISDNDSMPADIDPELQLDWQGGAKGDVKLHTDTC